MEYEEAVPEQARRLKVLAAVQIMFTRGGLGCLGHGRYLFLFCSAKHCEDVKR
jgi:hypothetical protein